MYLCMSLSLCGGITVLNACSAHLRSVVSFLAAYCFSVMYVIVRVLPYPLTYLELVLCLLPR